MDLYEPLATLIPVAADLWIANGPHARISGVPFPTRMVVVRLHDGGLWVWSPIEPTVALFQEIDALGPVAHLVSPNKLHYAHIATWKRTYPSAVAWASPGVRDRAASQHIDVSFDRDLAESADDAWASSIDQVIFRGSRLVEEVVFFHRPTKTLIFADLIENFEADKLTFIERTLAKLGGVLDPDGKAPGDFRLSFFGHRDTARACVAQIRGWKPERIVMAHGRWYDRDAEVELQRAFRWLD
ncbi:MAG: DUF4336 domain-containing protein [Polyangiaceae bacterium]